MGGDHRQVDFEPNGALVIGSLNACVCFGVGVGGFHNECVVFSLVWVALLWGVNMQNQMVTVQPFTPCTGFCHVSCSTLQSKGWSSCLLRNSKSILI